MISNMGTKSSDRLVIFEDKKIRRIFHEEEWYFSIVDIIEVLSGNSNPRRYTEINSKFGFWLRRHL